MSLKNKLFSGLTVAVATAAFAVVGIAQDNSTSTGTDAKTQKSEKRMGRGMGDRKMGRHGSFGRHGGMMGMRGIELTESQKAQIKSLHETYKPSAAAMEEMKTLFAAKRSGTITADQQSRLAAIKEQRKVTRQLIHDQMQSILTPEQKAQIEQKKVEMKARREEMKERRKEFRQKRQAETTTDTETKDN